MGLDPTPVRFKSKNRTKNWYVGIRTEPADRFTGSKLNRNVSSKPRGLRAPRPMGLPNGPKLDRRVLEPRANVQMNVGFKPLWSNFGPFGLGGIFF